MPDVFDEIAEAPATDIFDEVDYTPPLVDPRSAGMIGGLGPPAPPGTASSLLTPTIRIPKVNSSDPRFIAALTGAIGRLPTPETASSVAALLNVSGGFAEGGTSPAGLATAATGPLGKVAQKLAALGWGAYAANQVPEAARAAGEASVTGTPQEKKEAYLGLGATVALPAAIGAGLVPAETPASRVGKALRERVSEAEPSPIEPEAIRGGEPIERQAVPKDIFDEIAPEPTPAPPVPEAKAEPAAPTPVPVEPTPTPPAPPKEAPTPSEVPAEQSAFTGYHGTPKKVLFTKGEYAGMTGTIEGVIQKRYSKSPDVFRIQIDGFPKPGGWSGKVTSEAGNLADFKSAETGKPAPGTIETPSDYPLTHKSEVKPTPAPVAKVTQELQKVARTEGQRSAKEVKSELVARLEKAIEEAPSNEEFNSVTGNPLTEKAKRSKSTVAINIPGDGDFVILNRKENFESVIASAKRIATSSEGTPKAPRSREVPDIADQAEAASKAYGSPENAYRSVMRQRDQLQAQEPPRTAEDRKAWNDQIEGAEYLMRELYGKTKAGRLELDAEAARDRVATYKEGAQGFEKEIARLEAIKRKTQAHKDRLADLKERYAQNQAFIKTNEANAEQWEQQAAKEKASLESQSMAGPGSPSATQGIVGMGGAVPSEFDQPNTYVSNMFAAIDRDRVAMGKPPMVGGKTRTWDEANQRALAQMNRDQYWIPGLIKSVLQRPRALEPWENAGLVWHRANLTAEYNNALGRIAQAFDDSKKAPTEEARASREQDLATAKTDAANIEDQLEELDTAVGKGGTGTQAGLALQAQKMGAGEDFTLIEMKLRKRAAVGGRRLTEEESAVIERQFKELQRINEELNKNLANKDALLAKAEADRAMAEVRAQSVPAFDKRVLAAAERIVSRLETAGDAAAQRLKARLANLGTTPDPTIVSDAAIWASGKIARLGLDLAKTTDALVAEFSEKIRPFAQAIWEQANRLIDAASADAPEVVQRAVKKADLAGQKEDFVSTVKKLVAKKQQDKLTYYVQKLARELYKNGVRDREEMVDALHAELQKAIPEITRRQTMDAFSGYGDYKRLSKEKITVDLRGMKGELQQIAKLEDMAKGEPPLKSGVERRTPTEVERQLIKLVNDAKNKFQIPVSNPEIQLKSSLDTLKTTLSNRIKDYEDRLARNDYAPRPRREVQMDEKATQLKAQAERIKKKFREGLLKDRMKNRNPWEKLMDWFTKYRRFTALSSPAVIPKLFAAAGWRAMATVAEDISGEALSKIPGIREISERAPTEGAGGQLKATMFGFGRAATKGLEDAAKVTKLGASDIDVLYGKYGESYTGEAELASLLLNIPGRLHGAIKAPVKRFGFEKAQYRMMDWHSRVSQQLGEWYAKQGFAVNSEALKYRIALDAYKYGNRAIFLQDNRVASAFNAALATLERRDKTGHAPAGPKALATAARFMFPVTKVPTNIATETLQYATGYATGPVRAYRAIRNGLDELTPDQADLIMRDLKKGSVGFAALTLGYVGYKSIGGLYEPTRKKKPIPPGSITMFGEQIPANLLHHPVLNTIQLGAQIHKTAEEKLRTHDPEAQGLSAGLLAAAWGLADEVPFVQGPHRLFEGLANPYTREKTIGQETRSIVVPQAVAWVAQVLDGRREKRPTNIYQRVFGPPAKLQQRTIKQAVEAGIPGLRQQVPLDTRQR